VIDSRRRSVSADREPTLGGDVLDFCFVVL
jgi:hypothetical protein